MRYVYRELAETDKAWIAGVFDGEGSINVSWRPKKGGSQKGAWTIRLRISNTHRETVEKIFSILGFGSIRTMKKRGTQTRDVYEWNCESLSAEKFIEAVIPYSVTKKKQLDLGLQSVLVRRFEPRNGFKILPETHAKLHVISQSVKDLNGHKPLNPRVRTGE